MLGQFGSVVRVCGVALLLGASPIQAFSADAQSSFIQDVRGARLEMIVEAPDGTGPFAAVVIAPGAGYDMRQPLIQRLATALVARHIAVVRFNWAYFTADPKQGKSSPDLSAEIENMRAALALARKDTRLDPERIAVAGKSVGSVVSFRVLSADPALRAGLLLTPLCTLPSTSAAAPTWRNGIYPGFATELRPLELISGEDDPLCRSPALYALGASNPGRVRIVVVGGDHGFEDHAGPRKAEITDANIDLAVANSVDFLERSPRAPAH